MLKLNDNADTQIQWSQTLWYMQDNTCSLEEDTLKEYQEKDEYINDQIYNNTIYYEDIMNLYKALQYDGAVDIYEMKATNDQVCEALYDFYNEVVIEEDE